MLRLTDCLLPLDHTESALKKYVIQRLAIAEQDLIGYTIFRRGYDARKKSAIQLVGELRLDVYEQKQTNRNVAMINVKPAVDNNRENSNLLENVHRIMKM